MDDLTKKLLLKTLATQSMGIGTKLPPAKKSKPKEENKINCYICVYFQITWNKKYPYSCRAHGFKGPQIPSAVVFNTSGEPCHLFTPKNLP